MYTSHGHHIPGTEDEGPPAETHQCGGIGVCLRCDYEVAMANTAYGIGETPGPHRLLRYFEYGHLPQPLQLICQPFASLAETIDTTLSNGPEKDVALRKLLESKEAAVRAALPN